MGKNKDPQTTKPRISAELVGAVVYLYHKTEHKRNQSAKPVARVIFEKGKVKMECLSSSERSVRFKKSQKYDDFMKRHCAAFFQRSKHLLIKYWVS